MASVLDHFEALVGKGLKVIPLRPDSKIPLCRRWTSEWDVDVVRGVLRATPGANIGLLLGDIVDVEGDSNEANDRIDRMVAGKVHPCYRSTKSVHHLFLTPDDSLRHFAHNKIEFRGHGHQSVLPPSQHNGVGYRWIDDLRHPVPPMPARLVEFYRLKRGLLGGLKPGHVKANCSSCGGHQYLHGKRFDLEVRACTTMGLRWQCRHCRTTDLRPLCRRLKRRKPG